MPLQGIGDLDEALDRERVDTALSLVDDGFTDADHAGQVLSAEADDLAAPLNALA